MSNTKICGTCKLPKDLDKDFYSDRSKLDGKGGVCKDCSKAYNAVFRSKKENKERLRIAFRKYEKSPKGKLTRKRVIKKRSLKPKTILQRLTHSLRSRIAQGIRMANVRKTEHTIDLIGCSWLFLMKHLEKQFTEGMSWDNYGKGEKKWAIDHIKPLISFDLTQKDQREICFHYTNLQPLWGIDNSLKGGKYDS